MLYGAEVMSKALHLTPISTIYGKVKGSVMMCCLSPSFVRAKGAFEGS